MTYFGRTRILDSALEQQKLIMELSVAVGTLTETVGTLKRQVAEMKRRLDELEEKLDDLNRKMYVAMCVAGALGVGGYIIYVLDKGFDAWLAVVKAR